MSQILRVAKHSTLTYLIKSDVGQICSSCQRLRMGYQEFSTVSKKNLDPFIRYKKKKWKRGKTDREVLHEQLTRTLSARMQQLSSAVHESWNLRSMDSLKASEILNSNYIESLRQDIETMDALRDKLSPKNSTKYSVSIRDVKEADRKLRELSSKDHSDSAHNQVNDFQFVNGQHQRLPNDSYEARSRHQPGVIDRHSQNLNTSASGSLIQDGVQRKHFEKRPSEMRERNNLAAKVRPGSQVSKYNSEHSFEQAGKDNYNRGDNRRLQRGEGRNSDIKGSDRMLGLSRRSTDISKHSDRAGLEKTAKSKTKRRKSIKEEFERRNFSVEKRYKELKTEQKKRTDGLNILRVVKGGPTLQPFNLDKLNLNVAKGLFKFTPADQENMLEKTFFSAESFSEEMERTENEIESVASEGVEVVEDFVKDAEGQKELMQYIRHPRVPKVPREEDESSDMSRVVDPFSEAEGIMAEQDLEWLNYGSIEGIITHKAKMDLEKEKKQQDNQDPQMLKTRILCDVFNQSLRNYIEACTLCGLLKRALHDVRFYRSAYRRGKSNYQIEDVEVYNSLLRGLVKMGEGINSIREVFSFFKEDGLKPNMQSYAICLAGIGHKSDYDSMIASFIVKDMIQQGLDVKDIFNQCTFLYNERSSVYKVLTHIIPDYEPNPPNLDVGYKGPLTDSLNTELATLQMESVNPLSGPLDILEAKRKAEIQFGHELDGYVTVPSIYKKDTKSVTKVEEKIKQFMESCRTNIQKAFQDLKEEKKAEAYVTQGIGIYPFLCLFKEEDYVDILCREVHQIATFSPFHSVDVKQLKKRLAGKVFDRYLIQQKLHVDTFTKLHKAYGKYLERLLDPNFPIPNQRHCWKKIVQSFSDGNSMELPDKKWSSFIETKLGDALLQIITSSAKILPAENAKKPVQCFFTVQRVMDGDFTYQIRPHPSLTRMMSAQVDVIFPTQELPMLCPPVPYTSPHNGGNFINTVKILRYADSRQVTMMEEATSQGEVGAVYDSLNVLGACAWRINKPVLEVALQVFTEGGNPDIDIPLLPTRIPQPDKINKKEASKEDLKKHYEESARYQKTLAEATSLWWTDLYRFSIANMFKDEVFWLPMNVDFRGRTYPVPPHLNHQGNDVVRGMLKFAKGKPLGERGLDWLLIQLVNLTGQRKRSSNADRIVYAQEMMPEILDSADNPLTGNKWWMSSDEPWQTLAACMEVAMATRSGNPSTFLSHFPVHQDGSCNGLQHYAALGRDEIGSKSVNLYPYDVPSDVYSEVVDLVKKEIESDIAEGEEFAETAKVAQRYLERKVIKQSIMTTVYGVTNYGAILQIKKQLKDREMEEKYLSDVSVYLTNKTFKCLSQMFNSAREIQTWFNQCAESISYTNLPVEWVTPLSFPVIQPYFKEQAVREQKSIVFPTNSNMLKVDSVKQKNGFAPNFIHSLDSTHMMLTALHCHRKGITFMSVHDCFWTHSCDVEVMNKVTREQFLALHNQPILDNLSEYFVTRFGDELMNMNAGAKLERIMAVPERGSFDLENVLQSTYFFS